MNRFLPKANPGHHSAHEAIPLRHGQEGIHHFPVHQSKIPGIQGNCDVGETVYEAVEGLGRPQLEGCFTFSFRSNAVGDINSLSPAVEHLEEDLAAGDLEMPDSVAAELGMTLDEEDSRLGVRLRDELAAILGRPAAGASAAGDLVYAIEGLAELDLAPEQDLVGHIRTLLAVMKAGGDGAETLEAVRKELSGYVSG